MRVEGRALLVGLLHLAVAAAVTVHALMSSAATASALTDPGCAEWRWFRRAALSAVSRLAGSDRSQ